MQDTFNQPAPQRKHWRVLLAALLLIALAIVGFIWYQYQTTKQPLDELPVPSFGGERMPFSHSLSIYGEEGLQRPLGVAVSASTNRIYVSETAGERAIRIFNRQGEELSAFTPPDTTSASRAPLYMAVSPEGELYVSDRHVDTIYIFSPDGEFVDVFEPEDVPADEWSPVGLTFDSQGNLYVTDVAADKHRVLVFDSEGALKLEFGSEGTKPGKFWFPNGIAVDDEGRIFVADGNNGRLQAFDADGELLWVIPRGFARGDLAMPRGVALDGEGRLLVADTASHVVKAYDISEGAPRFLFDIGGRGIENEEFRYPGGIAIDSSHLYVADRENGRIQIWSY